MRAQGFDHAQVTASLTTQDEVNIANNEPSLLRSTEVRRLALLGLVDGRKASTELSDFDARRGAPAHRRRCYADASSAPQDAANAVSSGQRARIVQGPQQGDLGLLADKAAELLAFRARETPRMMLDEGAALHTRTDVAHADDRRQRPVVLPRLVCAERVRHRARRRAVELVQLHRRRRRRPARAATRSSTSRIDEMLRDTERQIRTEPIGANFVGDVVLMPNAVANLVGWLLGQLGDVQLIAGSSLYRDRVGALDRVAAARACGAASMHPASPRSRPMRSSRRRSRSCARAG